MRSGSGYSRLRVGLVVLLGIAGVLGFLFLSPIVNLFVQPSEPRTLTEALALPDRAENAIYRVDDQEVRLVEGVWEGRMSEADENTYRIETHKDVARGDLTEDRQDDTLLILTKASRDTETSYYVAAALRDGSGYVGTNAFLLGDGIQVIRTAVTHGVAVVEYTTTAVTPSDVDLPQDVSTAYFVVAGSELIAQGPMEFGEVVLWGELTFSDGGQLFTPCFEEPYRLDPESRALPALELAYRERGVGESATKKLFVVLAGTEQQASTERKDGDDRVFRPRLVLAAPYEETCEAAPLTNAGASVP